MDTPLPSSPPENPISWYKSKPAIFWGEITPTSLGEICCAHTKILSGDICSLNELHFIEAP